MWKPPGLLSVPAPGRRGDDDLISSVARSFGQAFAVHRLDEETSGLMLVALDAERQKFFKDALAERLISRAYLALVSPAVPESWTLNVENHLVRDRGDGRRGSGPSSEGKRAVTHFRARATISSHVSLVEARLETGRTHQIRIHASEAGYPVLGDTLYGPKKNYFDRLALHAYSLAFVDPDGEKRHFEVGLPDDIEAFVQRGGRTPTQETSGRPSGRKSRRKHR